MNSAWIIKGNLPAWQLRPSAESLPGSRLTFSVRRKTATRALRPTAVETTTGGTARSPSDPPFRDALIPSYARRLQLSSRLGGRPGLSSFLRVGYYWAEANEEVERWSALLGRCPSRRGREADEMREVEPWSRLG